MDEPLELVIFDCDGVLVDSEPLVLEIHQIFLRRLGVTLSDAEFVDRFVGRTPGLVDDVLAAEFGTPLSAEMQAERRQMIDQAFDRELKPVDGLLEALAEIDLQTCVASSSTIESLDRKLELVGLHDHFAGRIFSGQQVQHGKPAPDLFLYAAAQIGVEPAKCVVVEDSQYGVMAARAAGMHVFAYTSGVSAATSLEGPETTLFTRMRDLPELIRAQASARP